jgi:hypothetical protein
MCNGDYSSLGYGNAYVVELFTNHLLNEWVSLLVYTGSCLVHQQHLGFALHQSFNYDECPRETDELTLPEAEVWAWVIYLAVDFLSHLVFLLRVWTDLFPNFYLLEAFCDILVWVDVKWVNIWFYCSSKQSWILWDNRDLMTQTYIKYNVQCKPTLAMLTLSRLISPKLPSAFWVSSKILNSPKVRVDFPEPVRPTTPILCLLSISKLMPWMTSYRSGRYLYVIFLISNLPSEGQFSLGGLGSSKSLSDGLWSM